MEEKQANRLKIARSAIDSGRITNMPQLYDFLTKAGVAKILGLNPSSFSNYKSENPGEFKLNQIILLAATLNIEIMIMILIFLKSIDERKNPG